MTTGEEDLTDEKEQRHREEVKKQALVLRPRIDEAISKLLHLTASHDPLELLGKVAALNLFGHVVPEEVIEQNPETKHDQSETHVEYLQSLILARPYPENPLWPAPEVVQECFDLVKGIMMDATVFHAIAAAGGKDDHESWIRVRQMLQALHLRGDSYSPHTRQTFFEIAVPHNEFLLENFGFSSGDFFGAIKNAEKFLNERLNIQMQHTMGQLMNLFERGIEVLRTSETPISSMEEVAELPELKHFREENASLISSSFEKFDHMVDPSIFRLEPQTEIENRIYNLLSLEFGENEDFLEKLPKWKGWPLNPSSIYLKPLIRHAGAHYLFHLPLFERQALKLIEDLIKQRNTDYWQHRFLPVRDQFLESKSMELFQTLLPGCRAYSNVFYDCVEDGMVKRAEVDGLITYGDALLIVEAKACKFSDEARRGGMKSLRTDLDSILEKAYQQATRVFELLRSSSETSFSNESGQEALRLREKDFSKVFLISVSLEKLPSLSTGLMSLRRLGLLQGKEWPWAICLNDLRIISEINEHPAVFLHYLTRRIEFNDYEQVSACDELDLFCHYMQTGLYFREDKFFDEADHVTIASHTDELDRYYNHLAGIGGDVPKPKMELDPSFERLLTQLEKIQPPHFVSAAMMIQNFDDNTRKRIGEEIEKIDVAWENERVRTLALAGEDDQRMLILRGGEIDTPKENIFLNQCRVTMKEHKRSSALAIIWHPPLSDGRLKVYQLSI